MKIRMFCTLVAGLLIAGRSDAGVDKARLRELSQLPESEVRINFTFSSLHGFCLGDTPNPRPEIERLQKQMKGDAGDVERCLRLGRLYANIDRDREAKEVRAQAIALCRQQVRQYPEDMSWLARLGEALIWADEEKEAEPLLRRAVQQAPNEGRAWLALAECLDRLAIRAAFGDKGVTFHSVDKKVEIPSLRERRPTAKQIASMRRLRKEARRCHDRAVELAPRQTKPFFRRIVSNWIHSLVEAGLREDRDEAPNALSAVLTPENAADMSHIARLTPHDPKNIGSAILVAFMAWSLHPRPKAKDDAPAAEEQLTGVERSLLKLLPAESRTFVAWGMDRLGQLAEDSDKTTAAAASEMLADVLMLMKSAKDDLRLSLPFITEMDGKSAKIVQLLHRAIDLDPSREHSWDALTGLLMKEKKNAEVLAVALDRIKLKDNAHNRFLVAKIYAKGDQFEKAAEQLRAGLQQDANDLDCQLGLIAVLLKRTDAPALHEAAEHIDALAPRMKKEKSKQRGLNYLLLRGIHAGLNDRVGIAKECFGQILHQQNKNGKPAAEALAALGEPLGPQDETLAIDYVGAWGGSIEPEKKRPEVPVLKVSIINQKFTDKDLIFLSAFPQLRALDLSFASITDAGLASLSSLTELRQLQLNWAKITDRGLIHLKPLRKLRILSLEDTEITDAGLDQLTALPELNELRIGSRFGSNGITNAGLAHLRELPWLRSLHLNMKVTNDGLAPIAAIPRLRALWIVDSKITDEGMKHFEHLAKLRELHLSGSPITDAGLAHLEGLHQLRQLDLNHARITDAGLIHLEKLTQLRGLWLNDTAITDAGLAHLRGLTQLRSLELNHGHRSPRLLLANFPDESPTTPKQPAKPRITDAGLKHLREMTHLKRLSLDGQSITPQGIADLRKVLPRLEVWH